MLPKIRIILSFYKYLLGWPLKASWTSQVEIKNFVNESCERDSYNSYGLLSFNKDSSPLLYGGGLILGRITLNLVFLFVVICFIACYGRSLPHFHCWISVFSLVVFTTSRSAKVHQLSCKRSTSPMWNKFQLNLHVIVLLKFQSFIITHTVVLKLETWPTKENA